MASSESVPKCAGVVGNTKPPPPSKHWCFTYNNYKEDDILLIKSFIESEMCSKCSIQSEIGEEGTEHLQGYLCFDKKRRPTCTKWSKKVHWEKCRSPVHSIEYCRKDETFDGKHRWQKGVPGKLKDPLAGRELYPWQQQVVDITAGTPDERKIYWIWEAEGNRGKTTLARSMCIKDKSVLYVGGKAKDIKCAISARVKDMKPTTTVLYGIPRDRWSIDYTALEEIKDGIFFNGKYESDMCIYPIPHVIVMANYAPDESRLSADRWEVIEI